MKKLLLVSYHFPPDAQVGSLRAQKFAKYLPDYGWQPYVLTVAEKYYPVKDPYRLRDVACLVVRTKLLWTWRDVYLKAKSVLARGYSDKSDDRSIGFETATSVPTKSTGKMRRFLWSLLWLPDDRTGWILPGVAKAGNLIRKHRIDTVMTSSPPHSTHLIGLCLKKFMKVRWVADFRDQWCLFPSPRGWASTELTRSIERKMERLVIENADAVIANTEAVRDGYFRKYSAQPEDKFICIPNGFDLDDFREGLSEKRIQDDKFTLSYIGDLYADRNPEIILSALSALIEDGMLSAHKVRIRFIGKVGLPESDFLKDLIMKYDLAEIYESLGPVPHSKAVRYMMESDVLLIFCTQTFMYPAKVFEYMASGSHIIAFTPSEGALSDLLRHYDRSIAVDPSDSGRAKEAILSCYSEFLQGRSKIDNRSGEDSVTSNEAVMKFERRRLAQQLSSYL